MSRGGSRPGERYGGPWYGQSSQLICFVGSARQAFLGLRYRVISKVGFEVRVQLDVPYYERRNVRILFERWSPRYPIVTVDGPTESRHRNGDGTLCLWYPDDDEDRRWVFSDGLSHLLGIITLHLFKGGLVARDGRLPGRRVGRRRGAQRGPEEKRPSARR